MGRGQFGQGGDSASPSATSLSKVSKLAHSSRRPRRRRRRWRTAMRQTQVPKALSPRKSLRWVSTCKRTSCVASSASARRPSMRIERRNRIVLHRSKSSPAARRSPFLVSATSARRRGSCSDLVGQSSAKCRTSAHPFIIRRKFGVGRQDLEIVRDHSDPRPIRRLARRCRPRGTFFPVRRP